MAETKSKSRWFRFSLRTLLLLLTALCIWLGFQVNAARRQREAVAAILSVGGKVYYDYQIVPPNDRLDPTRAPPGPDWLRQYIGDDYFRTAVSVDFSGSAVGKGDLDHLAKLASVRFLVIINCDVRDADLSVLAELEQLELLQIHRAGINGAILAWLPNPGRLKFLCLDLTDIDDTAIKQIAKMTKLRILSLRRARISNTGLAYLENLEDLAVLLLDDTDITDAGLQHLTGLKKLTNLSLEGTQVSDAGVRMLREALPTARIDGP